VVEFGQNGLGGFSADEGFGAGIVLGEIGIAGRRSSGRGPRRKRCRVILEKSFSTALSQEAEVGVKWKVQRG